jgi:polyhydroxybutyrate depolymerase
VAALLVGVVVAVPWSSAAARVTVGCGIGSAVGQRTVRLFDQGEARPFLLFVPRRYDGHHRLPLVLNLHASNSNGAQQMDISQMRTAADRRGIAVAAPNGAVRVGTSSYSWNVPGERLLGGAPVPAGTPSDERYLLHVIGAAERSLCIDAKRIYLTGYSGGGRIASQIACDYPNKIAAIAPVAGLRAGAAEQTSPGHWRPRRETCRPDRPVAVLAFHGAADPVYPYRGSQDPRTGYGVEAALARWARIDRCPRGPRTTTITASVSLISYTRCRGNAMVSLYREDGAGHTWPGSTFPAIGPIDHTINATALMLRFFAHHSL